MSSVALSRSPLFTSLLAKRGFTDPDAIEKFLNPDLRDIPDPFLMKGMDEAVERLRRAAASGEKILVHGDYDVDGITGTAVVSRTLQALKIAHESFLPHRTEHGYGVSTDAIKRAAREGVSVLITVDCGITAHEPIQAARTLGFDVIVIDHHRIPEKGLPPANIILNPLQTDCAYPFKELSAGGLAFKLSQALIGEEARRFLDLVALSTISDVAPLREENRVLVKKGLEALSQRKNIGLAGLAEVAGLKAREINSGHVGFILGPRLNAAGRMSSPDIALRLLLTDHSREAESLAEALQGENKLRQQEERSVLREALREAERTFHFNRDRVVVVSGKNWHPGVIGIVASRLVERYHRPSLVMTSDGKRAKGSGRSIRGFHLFDALKACEPYLEQFGGHEQAVGFSLNEDQIPDLRRGINEHALENYPAEAFIKSVSVDLEVPLDIFRLSFLEELKELEPYGPGNPRPNFLTQRLEVKTDPVAFGSQSYRFWVTDGLATGEAVVSERAGAGLGSFLRRGSVVDAVYSVKSRSWNGSESLVLEVKEIKQRA